MAGESEATPIETIGQRLKRLRLECGLSQRELSAPGVSYAYISRIEAGTRQPSVKAVRRLAAKLGVSAEYLETGSYLPRAEALELELTDLELAVRLGDAQGAQEPLQRVLEEALATGDRDAALRARVALAILAKEAGDLRRMATLLEDAAGDETFAPIEHVDLYLHLGGVYVASGRPKAAVELFERCLQAAQEPDVPPVIEARFATLLSSAISETGDLPRAEDVVTTALARFGDAEDMYSRVRLYRSLSHRAWAEDRPGPALANARKALALLEATEDTLGLARARLHAASIMIERGSEDEATRHLDLAERLLNAAPSPVDTARLRVKRAQVATVAGDGPAAVAFARQALETIGEERIGERGAAYHALADGLALEGSYADAREAYERAVDLLEQGHERREATRACRAWARMLRDTGRETQALDVLDRATELGLRTAPAESLGTR